MRARGCDPFFTEPKTLAGEPVFVEQSGGHVKLFSEVGHGTTVKLYLPRHQAPATSSVDFRVRAQAVHGTNGETIPIVEDDDHVHDHTTGILRELGYFVLKAHIMDGKSGMDLPFTDVGLPRQSQRQVLGGYRARAPPRLKGAVYLRICAMQSFMMGHLIPACC